MSQIRDLAIATPRLILRDFVEGDLADVHAWRSDPAVSRFMDDFAPETLDQARAWLAGVISHNRRRPRRAYNLAIVPRSENKSVGWIGIGESERYATPGELGFGYALGSAHWNRGYATEAARAIVAFGFRALGGGRISAWCREDNRASARVLEKAGLSLERRFEQSEPKSGRLVACREYAIRRAEWEAEEFANFEREGGRDAQRQAPRLLATTDDAEVDRVLAASIGALEAAFPGRIRAVYLSGSYAGAEATPASDVDGLVVFRGELTDDEARRFAEATRALSRRLGMLVDLGARGEADLLHHGELPAKAASRKLVSGEDTRDAWPAVPLWRYTAQIMPGSWFYLSLVRGGQVRLSLPLPYPDPDGEFFGYERNGLRSLDGWDRPGLKALVGGMTLAASTLVAIAAGVGVVRAADGVASYRTYVGDGWADWLAEVYARGKSRWGYRVPESAGERRALPELCRRALDFENHFLAVCQDYLIAELRQPEPARRALAAACLRQIRPDDDARTPSRHPPPADL